MSLAHRTLVLRALSSPRSLSQHGRRSAIRSRGSRGFTLMELMVVVVVVALLAVAAIPSLARAKTDRHVYDDAGYLMQQLRTARTRALARGAATMVTLTADGTATGRGTFTTYESVVANVGAVSSATNRTPNSSCVQSDWTQAAGSSTGNSLALEGISFSGQPETNADLRTNMTLQMASGTTTPSYVAVCFTPRGRVYATTVSSPLAFTAATTFLTLDVKIQGTTGGTTPTGIARHVLLSTTGIARIYSR